MRKNNKELRQFAGVLMMLGSGLAKKSETKVELFATGLALTVASDQDLKKLKEFINNKNKDKDQDPGDVIDIEYQEVK